MKEVRDPLYGLVEYNDTEERIINSPLFQRLRNIRQLALASWVYPGAHHTRFEHCIGTMHLAGKVAKKLELGCEKRQVLRLAGLLHDIGHGPFSHVSEQVMQTFAKQMMDKYQAASAHELMSIILIEKFQDLANMSLDQGIMENVVKLLKKQDMRSLEKDIISGPLDVDKLDYIRRDSYFAGVQYGAFDLEKVIHSLIPIRISSEEQQLGVDEEGIYAVEQLLLAKYHMNAQVYRHRVRRITDAMLVRGIEFALREQVHDIERLFKVEDSDSFLQHYIRNDDNTLIDLVLKEGKATSGEYFKRIKDRRLLKEVFAIEINSSKLPDTVQLRNMLNLSEPQIEEIGKRAAEVFSYQGNTIDHNLVIVDKQTLSNPTFRSPQDRIDSNTIMVASKSGQRSSFPNVSTVFRNPSIGPETETLYIYLPLDWIEDKQQRNSFIEGREAKMVDCIREVVK